MSKIHANRGVERNKKPLPNIIYKIDVLTEDKFKGGMDDEMREQYKEYKFKDEGYILMHSKLQKGNNFSGDVWFWEGFKTADFIKELLGEKQWSKFCTGKREFIIQRRIDGKNIKKDNK